MPAVAYSSPTRSSLQISSLRAHRPDYNARVAAFPTITGSHNLIARAREVLEHHRDEGKPGKPLFLMIPGALLALGSAGFMLRMGFLIWVTKTVTQDEGMPTLLLFLLPYFAGIFIFCYGYELYNLPKAMGLTIFAGIIGLAAIAIVVCIVAIVVALISGDKKGVLLSAATKGARTSSGSSISSFSVESSGPGLTTYRTTSQLTSAQTQRVMADLLNLGLNIGTNTIPGPAATMPLRTHPDACSKCAQPIDPNRVVSIEIARAHPNEFCPQCCQPYVAAGYGASASS